MPPIEASIAFGIDEKCVFMELAYTIIPILCNLKSMGLHLTEFTSLL